MEWQWALLLLPVTFFLGWSLAKRNNKKSRRELRFSNDYFQGLNYLLNDEQDKALDVFLRLVEVDWETVDTSLALATIFRRKGEIDKSIKLHQNLLARPSLPAEYQSRVLLELGRDYQLAGWLDRAEGLFNQVLVDSTHAQQALQNLITIYQQEQEWHSAINAARRLQKNGSKNLLPVIAQFYCELSEQMHDQGDAREAEVLATQALSTHENCVRASIILADIAIERGRYKKAIRFLQQVEYQDSCFLPLIRDRLINCYRSQSNLKGLITYLQNVERRNARISLTPVLTDLINEVYGQTQAMDYLTSSMQSKPSLEGVKKILDMNIDPSDYPETRLADVVGHILKERAGFQCNHCGYAANTLYWLCPSCQSWGAMKPR
jgi:lipopolysaccharide biosynthesis regulator YciM